MTCGDKTADVDAYIAKAEPFARPILERLRDVIHEACPDVEEKMRWSFPHFDHKGMMLSFASFKSHCAFTFAKQAIMNDPEKLFADSDEAMGSLGRITDIKDLPSNKILSAYIKEAVRLNDEGIKVPKAPAAKKKEIPVPDDFKHELARHAEAKRVFDELSPSHRYEYLEWITDAKREDTRRKRIAQTIEWLGEGKHRNWKYEK